MVGAILGLTALALLKSLMHVARARLDQPPMGLACSAVAGERLAPGRYASM